MLVQYWNQITMADRLLVLHILLIIIEIMFFLVTLGSSIFFTMTIISSKVSGGLAGNLMVLALLPPSILTVIFLQRVAGTLYDRLHVVMIKSSLKKWLCKSDSSRKNRSSGSTIRWVKAMVIFFWVPKDRVFHSQWPESIESLFACVTFSAMPFGFSMTTPSYFKWYLQIYC